MYYRQQGQGQGFFFPIPGLPGSNVNQRLNQMERQIERLDREINRINRRLERIERRLGMFGSN